MDIKQLNTLIARIKTGGAKLDANIQEAALACLEQAEQHGNVIPANKLWQALPNGSRRNALGVWLCKYGKIRINTGKDKDENRFRFDKQGQTDMQGAAQTMWYSTTAERPLEREFNLTSKLLNVLQQYRKHVNELTLTEQEQQVVMLLERMAAEVKRA